MHANYDVKTTPSCALTAMHQNQKTLSIPEGKLSDVTAALIHRELRLFDLKNSFQMRIKKKREKPTNLKQTFLCNHVFCFNLKQYKAYYKMASALFCLLRALIREMLPASLNLQLLFMKLWTFY